MNYRHVFHAGNACDVLKHAVLTMIVERLSVKDAPFRVLDTHAGIGLYDLTSEEALKTREFDGGIGPLLEAPLPHPALTRYLDVVRSLNPDGVSRRYPGSPALVNALIRPIDRQVLVELHPEDHAALKRLYARDDRVAVHKMDAHDAIKAHLPPPERRGLVLIDPPFEEADEFERLVRAIKIATKRWAGGVFALWYPIKDRLAVGRFHEAVIAEAIKRASIVELTTRDDGPLPRLIGSGLLLVNPPWKLTDTLREVLPALHAALPHQGGGWRVDELTGEE